MSLIPGIYPLVLSVGSFNRPRIIKILQIVSLLVQFGLEINSDKIIGIVQTICSILIILGLLNDPTDSTKGYIPGISDKLVNKE